MLFSNDGELNNIPFQEKNYDEITFKLKNGFFLLSSAIDFNDYSCDRTL